MKRSPVALLCLAGALAVPAGAQAAESLVGVTADNRLVIVRSDVPSQVQYSVPLAGLVDGERIVGLDRRPATGTLYALGASSRVYTVDPASGWAMAVGLPSLPAFAPALEGTAFGFDFNPTVDRIRVVSDTGQDLRLNPETGTVAAVDGQLRYAPGDAGAGTAPKVVEAAYTNSVRGATTTTLYDIDAARDVLVTQAPPNDGVLNTVGPLGLDVAAAGGFDIAADGTAYAALTRAGAASPALYSVNLTSGATTLLGSLAATPVPGGPASPIVALAASGPAPEDRRAPGVVVGTSSRTSGVRLTVACDEACALTAAAGGAKASGEIVGGAGRTTLTLAVPRTSASRLVAVTVTATDSAGNASTTNVSVRVPARR